MTVDTADPAHHGGTLIKQRARHTYILTRGLVESAKMLKLGTGLNVPPPEHEIYAEVHERLKGAIQNVHRHAEVLSIDAAELGQQVLARANEVGGHCQIISTCPEIALPGYGNALQVNRLVNLAGEKIGIGPRPGFLPLSTQVRNLTREGNGAPIVLAEDGIFSGQTIRGVVDLFRQYGGLVITVVAGFMFAQADGALANLKDQLEIITVMDQQPSSLMDWMPDHDFLPLVPNCGRVLGLTFGDEHVPYYDRTGRSYAVPYLHGFCPMNEWASIPPACSLDLARTSLTLTQLFFQEVERLNQGVLTVGKLVGARSNPRVSMPFGINSPQEVLGTTGKPPRSTMPVYQYLESLLDRLQ